MYEKSKLILSQIPKVFYENRYCDQKGFSILVCGGKDKKGKFTNEVLKLEIPSFKVKKLSSMVKPHLQYNKFLDESFHFLEVNSEITKTRTYQYVKKRTVLFNTSFISKLSLIGGWIYCSGWYYRYDINNNTLNFIVNLNVARDFAASTVFEGKIVVTGGLH